MLIKLNEVDTLLINTTSRNRNIKVKTTKLPYFSRTEWKFASLKAREFFFTGFNLKTIRKYLSIKELMEVFVTLNHKGSKVSLVCIVL